MINFLNSKEAILKNTKDEVGIGHFFNSAPTQDEKLQMEPMIISDEIIFCISSQSTLLIQSKIT